MAEAHMSTEHDEYTQAAWEAKIAGAHDAWLGNMNPVGAQFVELHQPAPGPRAGRDYFACGP